mmetsp:Transcript_138762/g.386973  ORF Transcript_138762/g.386973 Transcript_138762/m.386973 type:complete len:115 (+) Transcript_138762:170-514(+)
MVGPKQTVESCAFGTDAGAMPPMWTLHPWRTAWFYSGQTGDARMRCYQHTMNAALCPSGTATFLTQIQGYIQRQSVVEVVGIWMTLQWLRSRLPPKLFVLTSWCHTSAAAVRLT